MSDAVATKKAQKGTEAAEASQVPAFSPNVKKADAQLAEAARNTWEVLIDDTTPLDLVTKGEFWTTVADQLTIRDLVYVQPRSGGWLAVLRVIFVDRRSRTVQVALLQRFEVPLPAPRFDIGLPRGWEVRYLDEAQKYGVFRDGTMLNSGFPDAQRAADYARSHASLR